MQDFRHLREERRRWLFAAFFCLWSADGRADEDIGPYANAAAVLQGRQFAAHRPVRYHAPPASC